MIFLCFSSKDRHTIVESILFHITNYGLPVWYDRYQMLLGDERDYKNFEEGIGNSKYAIIILSPNAINSICACEEIELIYQKYLCKELYVFPVFFCLKAHELPQRFMWMTKLVYKELDEGIDSLSACNHIICKYLSDKLEYCKLKTIKSLLEFLNCKPVYSYISSILTAYNEISNDNHNAKISLLYAGALFCQNYYTRDTLPSYCTQGIMKLFSDTKLHLPIDQREGLIYEHLFLLIFNFSIFGNVV